jgi:hypothetical protein
MHQVHLYSPIDLIKLYWEFMVNYMVINLQAHNLFCTLAKQICCFILGTHFVRGVLLYFYFYHSLWFYCDFKVNFIILGKWICFSFNLASCLCSFCNFLWLFFILYNDLKAKYIFFPTKCCLFIFGKTT